MKIRIKTENDIIISRSAAKNVAKEMGFGIVDQTKIATAISELARNVVAYAEEGFLVVKVVHEGNRDGIEIICEDRGPGIEDVALALKEGYSTSGGLGMGLCGARKLMDGFEIESEVGKGTRIVVTKWL